MNKLNFKKTFLFIVTYLFPTSFYLNQVTQIMLKRDLDKMSEKSQEKLIEGIRHVAWYVS